MRLHFAEMNLPSGAAVYVYSPNEPGNAAGPYAEAGLLQTGEFWSRTTRGDTAYIEYCVLDASQAGTVPFKVDQIGHVYRPLDGDGPAEPRSWDSCMQDVACYFPTWENTSYAVAKLTNIHNGNLSYCSGTLLATLNADNTPYFLTSAHCIDTAEDATTAELRWFYQRETCGGSFMVSQSSDVVDLLVTTGAGNPPDYSLLLIRGALPPGVYWSGWTTTPPASGSWSVGVHHAGGYEKRYSRGQYTTSDGNFNYFSFGVTGAVGSIYYGSSGSGVFTETDQKLYGNLSGATGDPGCDYPDSQAGYGKFSNYYSTIAGYLAAGSDDVFAGNGSCATARPLGAGSYPGLVVKRYGINGSQGEDWYKLTVSSGTQVTVTLAFTNACGDINAELYNACGGAVVASATGTTDGETLVYMNSGATAGFYLRIFLASNTRNNYDMTIQGAFADCNNNLKDDACDMSCAAPGCADVPACGQSRDCNGNGVPDECDLASGTSQDCNGNGVPDSCDIASGTSQDCNSNGIPDECEGGDLCPPANLHWVQSPTAISTTSITMQAAATDPSGVEYYFSGSGPGSHSRNWNTNPVFTDLGLQVNRNYSYKVKARDQSPAHNETPYTDPAILATLIETPTALSFGTITTSSIDITAPGTFSNLTSNASGLFFEVTTLGGAAVGGSQANSWVQVQTVTASGLAAGTTYRFRVKARNYYGVDQTPWFPATGYVNQTTSSGSCALLGDINGDGQVNGLDVNGFVSAKLGLAPLPGENQACANFGGTLDQDLAAFIALLLDPACALPGDVNGDGFVNGLDVDGFVRAKLGAASLPGENPGCANYGGTLDQDIAAFIADLLSH